MMCHEVKLQLGEVLKCTDKCVKQITSPQTDDDMVSKPFADNCK